MWKITQRGIDYFNTHNSLQESDLLKFPEFVEFAKKKKPKRDPKSPKDISKQQKTPIEDIDRK